MTSLLIFMKTYQTVQKLVGDTQRDRQTVERKDSQISDIISLTFILKEIRIINMKAKSALKQCFSNLRQSRTSPQAVGAHTDHLRKIPQAQKWMRLKRRNIIPVVKVTMTAVLLYIH
jgi:hypothetical protein